MCFYKFLFVPVCKIQWFPRKPGQLRIIQVVKDSLFVQIIQLVSRSIEGFSHCLALQA